MARVFPWKHAGNTLWVLIFVQTTWGYNVFTATKQVRDRVADALKNLHPAIGRVAPAVTVQDVVTPLGTPSIDPQQPHAGAGPIAGALAGYAGLLLIDLMKSLNLFGAAFNAISWAAPREPTTLAVAFLLGFSARLLDRMVSQAEDSVATRENTGKGQRSADRSPLQENVESHDEGTPGPNHGTQHPSGEHTGAAVRAQVNDRTAPEMHEAIAHAAETDKAPSRTDVAPAAAGPTAGTVDESDATPVEGEAMSEGGAAGDEAADAISYVNRAEAEDEAKRVEAEDETKS